MSATKPVLYHIPFFCSSRPLHVIHYLQLEDKIDVKTVDFPFIKSPEYLKINPHGSVPAFVEADGNVVLESGAIALYIADKYGDKEKLFGEEKKKGQLFQWLFYAPATMYPLVATAYAEKHIPDAHKDPARVARAKDRFQTCIELIDSSLGNNHFLLGTEHPTLADIYVSYELFGSLHLGWLEEATHPRLKAYLDRMGGLECFKKTYPSG